MSFHIGEVPADTDVLVIGSGFGGSVVAAELAAAGTRVTVVERGNHYPPGSFPRGPAGFATNFWDPKAGLHGMFDVWSFRGLETVVAAGLGGGSLIYANVMLRKPDAWFRNQPHPYRPGVSETWSFTRADLDPHYDAVQAVLDVQELPTGPEPLDPAFRLPKTAAFRRVDGARAAPLAVQFRAGPDRPAIGAPVPDPGYPNLFGQPRRTCRMCGECDVGCNEGAKNSMDHTYLSMAAARGAVLHTRTEVTGIAPTDGGFEVALRVYPAPPADPAEPSPPPSEHVITARQVVLAAGTLGSTYLMLRNRAALGLHNPVLGSRFCGNGDLLGFILGTTASLTGWRGPVITSYLGFPDDTETGDPTDFGMYLQDAGYPEFAAWLTDTAASLLRLPKMAKVIVGEALGRRFHRSDTSLSAELSEFLGRPTVTSHGLPVLGMGLDIADGTLYLDRARPAMMNNTWSTRSSAEYFDILVDRMRRLAEQLGGRLTLNPTYRFRRVISVHPLGGCPADTDRSAGVVDGFGRVRGVPGLRICDGSVFPGPVGANPSMTIAAFARRAARQLIEHGDPADWPPVVQP